MRQVWSWGVALCLLLTSSCGSQLPIDEGEACVESAALPQKAHFTDTKHQYLFKGECHVARLRVDSPGGNPYFIPIDAPFTAEGYYEPQSQVATEIFRVPEPKISEPSRPWGTFQSSFRCEQDPWLNDVKCEPITASVNPPSSAYPGPRYEASRLLLNEILSKIGHFKKPYSAAAVRYASGSNKAIASAWAAYRKQEQLAQGARQSPGLSHSAGVAPSILRPAAGQVFLRGNPIPIKLGPPVGWTVTTYMVKLQVKDARGIWVESRTIPVGALQAHSPGGYTGFGIGGFPTYPGTWRVSAQVSAPNQSGWSNAVEFKVATPPPTGSQSGKAAIGKGSLMRPQ
ncbi:MAG: hypothetical protein P0111_10375 [Nitrospira sp.]|nr:hypothetical protein [Nitrospira sp.]